MAEGSEDPQPVVDGHDHDVPGDGQGRASKKPPPPMAPSPWIQTITGLGSAQGAAGCGGRQRRSLAVEAAYGMPRNSRYSSVTVPRTELLTAWSLLEELLVDRG
jgi:hypothetical protein